MSENMTTGQLFEISYGILIMERSDARNYFFKFNPSTKYSHELGEMKISLNIIGKHN